MTSATTVAIIPVEGAPDALLHIYPGQNGAQDCFIELDLRDGAMTANYNGEIGNAIPSTVYHGVVRRYPIPVLQPATANALMERIAPLAQRVLDGAEIVWDGSNHVARLNADARRAEDEIAGDGTGGSDENEQWHDGVVGILYPEMESDVYYYGAAEWLGHVRREIIAQIRGEESLDDLYDYYNGDGAGEDTPVLVGLMPYLERLRDEMGAE
jgi:hypothetical protein